MTQYTVEAIETTGIECSAYTTGALRNVWVMPSGDLVSYAGYGQVVSGPETCYTKHKEALQLCRSVVANNIIKSDERLSNLKSTEGWVQHPSAVLCIATFDENGTDVEVALAVKFEPSSARPTEVVIVNKRFDVSLPPIEPILYPLGKGVHRVLNVFDHKGGNGCLLQDQDNGQWRDNEFADSPNNNRPTQAEALQAMYARVAYEALDA